MKILSSQLLRSVARSPLVRPRSLQVVGRQSSSILLDRFVSVESSSARRTTQLSSAEAPPITTARYFSSDSSHDDFAPKRKAVEGEDAAIEMIKDHVKNNRIMLYMKGNPSMPMCGFSAQVVQVLKDSGADFASVNVLDYPAIREGVKKHSDWPTIPQLYVDGEFIGGCDIVVEMNKSGELKELLQEEGEKK